MATETLDEKIARLTRRKADLVSLIAHADGNIPISQAYVRKMVAEGNLAEANKVSTAIENLDASRRSAIAELKTIEETLTLLQEQKAIQLTAQTAVVNQANAIASQTGSQAQLTAEQQYQLQLAKIETDKNTSATRAMQDANATAQAGTEKAKTTRNYIIAGIISVVIIIVVAIIYKKK